MSKTDIMYQFINCVSLFHSGMPEKVTMTLTLHGVLAIIKDLVKEKRNEFWEEILLWEDNTRVADLEYESNLCDLILPDYIKLFEIIWKDASSNGFNFGTVAFMYSSALN